MSEGPSCARHSERLYESLIEEAGTRPTSLYDTAKSLAAGLNSREASKEVQETREPGAASRHYCALYQDLRVSPPWMNHCRLEATATPLSEPRKATNSRVRLEPLGTQGSRRRPYSWLRPGKVF